MSSSLVSCDRIVPYCFVPWQVVEAGGVPAFLSYLQSGFKSSRRDMVMDALFALSNVAGGNNATVQALLEAGGRAMCVFVCVCGG